MPKVGQTKTKRWNKGKNKYGHIPKDETKIENVPNDETKVPNYETNKPNDETNYETNICTEWWDKGGGKDDLEGATFQGREVEEGKFILLKLILVLHVNDLSPISQVNDHS